MKKPESEQLFANALNTIPELGPIRLTKILNFFGSYEAAFNKSASQYINAGLEANISNSIAEKMRNINPEEEYEKTKKHNIRILLNSDPAFPQLLKEIIPSPPLLYIRGDLSVLNNYCLGIVGTRKISNYGLRILSELIPILVTHKITIVSGLAFGTDAAALEETIRCGGQTISILPSPVDDNSISPRANLNLARKILESGCIASEYAIGSTVQKQNFPVRNRIISGLCAGTIVIEADEGSGALITAKYALEQNRIVMAVPGSIFSPQSRGCNQLIKSGAFPILNPSDVIEALNLDLLTNKSTVKVKAESNEEQMIIDSLDKETEVDELVQETKLPISQINTILTLLEIKGVVKNLGGNRYVKIR